MLFIAEDNYTGGVWTPEFSSVCQLLRDFLQVITIVLYRWIHTYRHARVRTIHFLSLLSAVLRVKLKDL